jgi:hypothetical protein
LKVVEGEIGLVPKFEQLHCEEGVGLPEVGVGVELEVLIGVFYQG